MQDIHDPWLIDEIDTLPEEFEMEEGDWQGRAGLEEMEQDAPFSDDDQEEALRPAPAQPAIVNERRSLSAPGARRKAARRPAARAVAEGVTAMPEVFPALPVERNAALKKASSRKKKRAVPKRLPPPAVEEAPASAVPALESLPVAFAVSDKTVTRASVAPQPLQKNVALIKVSSEGDYVELVRQIVKEHPQYGPTMIGKFFETRVDPPVKASRSTIYRWLRLAGLSTRDQRSGFAEQTEPVSPDPAMPDDIFSTET